MSAEERSDEPMSNGGQATTPVQTLRKRVRDEECRQKELETICLDRAAKTQGGCQ